MNAFKIGYLNDLIFGFIGAVLFLRVVLKLLGAREAAPFVNWVYEITAPLIAPFQDMFPSPVLTGGFIIEASTLFALLAYALVSYAIRELLEFMMFERSSYYQEKEKLSYKEKPVRKEPRVVLH